MDIPGIKLFVIEPVEYKAQSNNKSNRITLNCDGNGGRFFETIFRMPVYMLHQQ
jgi:hypothetical protein